MWPDRKHLRSGEVYIDRQLLTKHGPGRGLDLARHCRPTQSINGQRVRLNRRSPFSVGLITLTSTRVVYKVERAALHPRQ